MKFSICTADTAGNATNCHYPHQVIIDSPEALRKAVAFDHVCGVYENNYRGNDTFLHSDVLVMDIDNTKDPSRYITEQVLDELFPDVAYALATSRNHNKPKGTFPPAPRYHVYFPIRKVYDDKSYMKMKTDLAEIYAFFDDNALDAGRFLFGCESNIIWHEGYLTIDEDLKAVEEFFSNIAPINEGSRNNTMSRFAARVLKRYGITGTAKEAFLEHAERCDPPLDDGELALIWNSAVRFYKNKVMADTEYIAPEEYNRLRMLKPEDFSDIGQAKTLQKEYGNELIYTAETDFLRYDGSAWVEDKQFAVAAIIEFLDLQLSDALEQLSSAKDALKNTGIDESLIRNGGKALAKVITPGEQERCYEAYLAASQYHAFVMKRRDMKYMMSTMGVVKSLLNHSINDLDKQEYFLNTPDGTYDLRAGAAGRRPHDANDLISKITLCSPGDDGEAIWQDALTTFFCDNQELIQYVQRVVGMTAVGKVFQEHLIIAYGDGANGKSTFWNTIARVLGSYSGKISAEILTVGNKRNAKPEMAELKGKRLIIASEMEEGTRLNTGMVKQLCSIDPIQAEKKYEKPFDFVPTHTLVLYTNHLPRVGANDDGTWRRLIVIPFNAKITGNSDIKNYADYLFTNAGSAIMKWIIEGAKDAISMEFKWPRPEIVQTAIQEYRGQNDWFGQFVEDCCEAGTDYSEKSSLFYDEYRSYCMRNGEYIRNSADFYAAIEKAGFSRKRKANGRYICGIRLRSEFIE